MKLLKSFFEYAAGSVLVLIVGLISTPVLSRLFSPDEMGKFSMFTTVGGLLSVFLYFGLDQSFGRFYYVENENTRSNLFIQCLKVPLISTTFISLIILMEYKTVSKFIIGQDSYGLIITFIIYLYCLVVDRFIFLMIRMEQKPKLFSALNVFYKLLYLAAALILYYFIYGGNSSSLIIGITIAEMLYLGLGLLAQHKELIYNKKEKIKTQYRELMIFGFPFIFSSTVTYVFQTTDKFMLNLFSNYEQIGIYTGALSIVNLIAQVQNVFSTFWVPAAYEHYSSSPDDTEFFSKINKIITYIMLVCTIVILCLKDIIIIFLGDKYGEAVYVFPFLILMPIMYTISETTCVGINFKKKPKYHIIISCATAVTNIIGCYILIQYFGAKGAAISTGLAYVVFYALRTYFSYRLYKVNYHLKKFSVSCGLIYALAIYASFNNVNVKFCLLSVIVVVILSIIYKDIFISGLKLLIVFKNRKGV